MNDTKRLFYFLVNSDDKSCAPTQKLIDFICDKISEVIEMSSYTIRAGAITRSSLSLKSEWENNKIEPEQVNIIIIDKEKSHVTIFSQRQSIEFYNIINDLVEDSDTLPIALELVEPAINFI